MKTSLWLILAVFLIGLSQQRSLAQEEQDTSMLWRIETVDGNEFFGNIMLQTSSGIELKTQNLGLIQIPFSQIKSMTEIRPELVKGNQVWMENPQATRYFWAPNGYGLRKGEGYYQNVWVFFNQVSFGITDFASLGAGIFPAFLVAGAETPVWITPKISIPVARDKFSLGGGALLGYVIGLEDSFFGIAYGVATVGNRDQNLSLGLGYGFIEGELADRPAISLAGMLRISRRSYLLTENYLINTAEDSGGILSFGGRTVWSAISIDYGLFTVFGDDTDFIAFPWLGLVIPFGKKSK